MNPVEIVLDEQIEIHVEKLLLNVQIFNPKFKDFMIKKLRENSEYSKVYKELRMFEII